jgi:hypothetical protein
MNRRLSARPSRGRAGRASSNSKARDAIGSRQPEPHELPRLPPGENWVERRGLAGLGLVSFDGAAETSPNFPFRRPPGRNISTSARGAESKPRRPDAKGVEVSSPDLTIRPLGCCGAQWDTVLRTYSETRCRGSSRKAWQLRTIVAALHLVLHAAAPLHARPSLTRVPSLNTPLQPWVPAVDFPLGPALAKSRYWAERGMLWIHDMRRPAL